MRIIQGCAAASIIFAIQAFIGVVCVQALAQAERPQFVAQDFNLLFQNKRLIGQELAKAITSPEFSTIAAAVASYYGIPPQQTALAIGIARTALSAQNAPDSEAHNGQFPAPEGYTTCRVEMLWYNPRFQSGASDVTFNMNQARTCQKPPAAQDWFGFYIVSPKSWAGTEVAAKIRVIYVLADPPEVVRLTNAGLCTTQNTCAWLCTNRQLYTECSELHAF